jgi:hypothetical protein
MLIGLHQLRKLVASDVSSSRLAKSGVRLDAIIRHSWNKRRGSHFIVVSKMAVIILPSVLICTQTR